MTSRAKNRLARRALIACVYACAMLIISLAAGTRTSLVTDSFAAGSVAQISSGPGPAAVPNRHCPFGNHAQKLWTCSSSGLVGLEQPAVDHATQLELKVSDYALGLSDALTKIYGSRLERPPRS
jgi:hypothetical protein